jgi:hypothetical protein
MTDFNFVPTKSHQSDKFALHRVPRAGHVLARKALSLGSPSTRITSPPPEDRSRCWQQGKSSANLCRNASYRPSRSQQSQNFALSLGGRHTSMYSFNAWFTLMTFLIAND